MLPTFRPFSLFRGLSPFFCRSEAVISAELEMMVDSRYITIYIARYIL
jgi:hypothetical protein